MFRDLDSDLSFGIPICGGCGGLGSEKDEPAFHKSTKAVMDSRFVYCPTEEIDLPPPHEAVLLWRLKRLIRDISIHYNTYKTYAVKGCFAEVFLDSIDKHVKHLEAKVQKQLADLPFRRFHPGYSLVNRALLAAFNMNLAAADQLFQRAIHENPRASVPIHDYGAYSLLFKRDLKTAMDAFVRSTTLGPDLILHHEQALRAAMLAKQLPLVRTLALSIIKHPDLEPSLIDGYKKLIHQLDEKLASFN